MTNSKPTAAAKHVVRKQNASSWGVYLNGALIEGGFFYRHFAEQAASEYNHAAECWSVQATAKVSQ